MFGGATTILWQLNVESFDIDFNQIIASNPGSHHNCQCVMSNRPFESPSDILND